MQKQKNFLFLCFYYEFLPSRWGGIPTISREETIRSVQHSDEMTLSSWPEFQNRQEKKNISSFNEPLL